MAIFPQDAAADVASGREYSGKDSKQAPESFDGECNSICVVSNEATGAFQKEQQHLPASIILFPPAA
jgi:hypothetical protein